MMLAAIIAINGDFRVELNLNICSNRDLAPLQSPAGAERRESKVQLTFAESSDF